MTTLTPLLFQHDLAADHPLRHAEWIWPEGYMDLHNVFADFRHDFELASVPAAAPFFVTADFAYRLYINGAYVCRGPARGYQHSWPFDEVDLTPHLRPGANWIAIEAYNPGISTFRYVHATAAGMLCAAEWGGVRIASGPKGWAMRRSPGRRVDTARLSMQLDIQEHVDLREADRSWITASEPPQWPRPANSMRQSARFGALPWLGCEPRGIPLLRETLLPASTVVCRASGACAEGYRGWRNVSWPWIDEARQITNWHEEGGDAVELPAGGEGRFSAVTIDVGEAVVGQLLVEATGAAGGEIVDFHYVERLVDGRPALTPPGAGCAVGLSNRLWLKPGDNTHEFYHPLGFRYVTVVGRDLSQPIKLRLRVRNIGYPFTMRGEFNCSDDNLNRIHAACRRTQQICSLDAYVDTPWREQAQWWGDARVQAWNTFHLDGDARLLARGIRSIAGQPGPFGLTYGHAPTIAHNCVLPDFSLTWVLTLWDHYWQTGDTTLVRELWPRVEQVFAYFDRAETRDRRGLIKYDPRFWYFGDWADIYRGGTPTLLNLYYLLATRELETLLRAAGMEAEAGQVQRRNGEHRERVMAHLYDPKARRFVGGLDDQDRPIDRLSLHDQTIGLLLDLDPDAAEDVMQTLLLPFLRGEAIDAVTPSAFWVTYVLAAAAQRGHGIAVIDYIRRRWKTMGESGTTWEDFQWTENLGTMSHAWTAHPSFHLVNTLVGLRQDGVAWEAVSLTPAFHPDLTEARALIPTPRGDVAASWRREGEQVVVNVAAPADVAVRVRIPGHEGERRGTFELRV